MTWFTQSKHLAVVAACIWANTLAASPATAQQPSSATINGTFIMTPYWGDFGPDLAAIVARGETHTWTLTLHGLSYSHDYELLYYVNPDNYSDRYITRVYATSFDFQFQGPDADELNSTISELVNGGLQGEPFVELRNYIYFDEDWDWLVQGGDWVIRITPLDFQQGFTFGSIPNILEYPWFTVDANGYPVLEPFTCSDAWAYIHDYRPGYAGGIGTQGGNTVSVSSVGFSLPGDFNFDGSVDGRDFLAWQRNPNVGQLADWQANYGTASLLSGSVAVPEPSSLLLLALAVPALVCRRKRQLLERILPITGLALAQMRN